MLHEHISVLYLIGSTLKFPVLKSKVWFSALARPNPTVRTDRIKVRSLPKTKRTAHNVNLAGRNKRYMIYQNSSTDCVTHISTFRYLYALCTKFSGRIIMPAKIKHFWNVSGKILLYIMLLSSGMDLIQHCYLPLIKHKKPSGKAIVYSSVEGYILGEYS